MHSTNYTNTFIAVSDDCPAKVGEIPPVRDGERSVATIQYAMLKANPYRYTSDDVLFHCFAVKNGLKKPELKKSRLEFFSKGQPCFRASPLVKRYGWGVHSDTDGKIALYGVGTAEYNRFLKDKTVKAIKGMNTRKP